MVEAKMLKLINGLRERTLAGAWRWTETADPKTYATSFPDYSAELEHIETENGHNIYTLRILDSNGRTIEEVSDFEIKDEEIGDQDSEQFFQQFYSAARRSAVGLDKALDKILENIEQTE